MPTLEQISQDIEQIKSRNLRVEADKALETSLSRRFLVLILTYLVTSLIFLFAGISNPFLNSIVPTVAFALSTLSLPIFKKLLLKYIHKNPNDQAPITKN